MRSLRRALLAAAALCCSASLAGASPFFAIDGTSPSATGGINDQDVLSPGPAGGPPTEAQDNPLALGLGAAIDAFSTPGSLAFVAFSIDRLSVGAGPATAESTAGQQAGDIYVHNNPGASLLRNQDSLGLLPNLPAGSSNVGSQDNVTALTYGGLPTLFSVAPSLLGPSGADILDATGAVIQTAAALGLNTLDDIDALHYDPGTTFCYFSLARGSFSLVSLGASAATIMKVSNCLGATPGPVQLHLTASDLLLVDATDNVTALASVPEPATAALLGLGVMALAGARKRPRS